MGNRLHFEPGCDWYHGEQTDEEKIETTPTINPVKDESSGFITHKKICEELNELYKTKTAITEIAFT